MGLSPGGQMTIDERVEKLLHMRALERERKRQAMEAKRRARRREYQREWERRNRWTKDEHGNLTRTI
jgi:hypothetical protein